MYKFFSAIALLIIQPLQSADLSTCYSVQLKSIKTLQAASLHTSQECREMKIGAYITTRCGCYESFDRAKTNLLQYKHTYPNAILVETYKYRFNSQLATTHTPTSLQIKNNNETMQNNDWNITNELLKQPFSFDSNTLIQTNYLQERFHTKMQKNQNKVQNNFTKQSDFYGLSLQGKYEQYLNQDYRFREYTDYEYDLKLQFDLFKDGYFEHKKANNIALKQEKIAYLQILSSVLKNRYDEQLLIANAALQETNIKYYKELATLYKEALEHRRQSYINSLTPQDELAALQQQYNRYKKMSIIYEKHQKSSLPNEVTLLLNKIEQLQLKESRSILKIAKQNNPDKALQQARISLFNEVSSYGDNVKLNLYVHRRVVDEMGWYNTVGIEGKLPLDFSSHEEQKLQKLEQHSSVLAQKSFENIIQNKLTQLIQNFLDLQQLIMIDKDDVNFLHSRIKNYKTIEQNTIPNLNYNPEDKIITLSKQLIDFKYQIALKKIELFKTLGNIAYLSNTPDISLLLKEDI